MPVDPTTTNFSAPGVISSMPRVFRVPGSLFSAAVTKFTGLLWPR